MSLSATPDAQEAEEEEPVKEIATPTAKATETAATATINATACLDTGSDAHNFIRPDIALELIRLGAKVVKAEGRVRLACNREKGIIKYNQAIIFRYKFLNKLTGKQEAIKVQANILTGLTVPLIIGLRSIHVFQLLCKQKPELCCKNPLCKHDVTGNRSALRQKTGGVDSDQSNLCLRRTDRATVRETTAPALTLQEHRTVARTGHPTCSVQRSGESEVCELCQLKSWSSRDLLGAPDDSDSDDDERRTNIMEMLPEKHKSESVSEMIEKIVFEGESENIERLRNLCSEAEFGPNLFSESVRAQAAHLPPMTLEVDYEKFRRAGGNRRSPRPQSQDKLKELHRMINELLELKVIRASTSDVVSQVLLVVKKGTTKLRFCIDYRALNDATQTREAWPIPNIKQMLERLGTKSPKFFGVMDLTSGYHQAPLSESAKRWTAFTTAFGAYEWNRVPMGLMGAPSYFQRCMMTNVLGNLLMRAVEVYLDDFIVFGSDIEEFISNLRETFQAFVKAGITLNPKKCRFGMSEVEFVGHTIDATGTHFKREKLDSILDMPRPTRKGEMKTFLGMVNHLHTHIKGLSIISEPLVRLIGREYKKSKKNHALIWDAEAIAAFEEVKKRVDECPKLWFEDDSLPVYV